MRDEWGAPFWLTETVRRTVEEPTVFQESKSARVGELASLDRRNVRAAVAPLALVLALGVAMATVVMASYVFMGIRPVVILDDAAAVMSAPWYVGAVNTLGIICWTVAGAVSLLASAAVACRQQAGARFLRAFGFLSVILMLDDQYIFHERIGRFELGIPETVTLALLVLLALAVSVKYRRVILRHPDAVILYCAFPFFALSLLIDGFHLGVLRGFTVAEEYSKFMGVLCWALFATRASIRLIRDESGQQSPN